MEEDRYTRITLRIPKDLHAQLQEAADDTSKSMNAEIVARLQQTFDGSSVLAVDGKPLVSEDHLHALLEQVASATALQLIHSLGEKGYLIEEMTSPPAPKASPPKKPPL